MFSELFQEKKKEKEKRNLAQKVNSKHIKKT